MILALKILLFVAVLAALGAWVVGALAYMNVLNHSARKGGLAKALAFFGTGGKSFQNVRQRAHVVLRHKASIAAVSNGFRMARQIAGDSIPFCKVVDR